MKKTNFKTYILLGVGAILALSSIFMTIETATSSVEVSKLQGDERTVLAQKRELEETLVKSLSMGQLQEESLKLGFIQPATLVYVVPTEPVAKLP